MEDTDGHAERTDDPQGRRRRRGAHAHRRGQRVDRQRVPGAVGGRAGPSSAPRWPPWGATTGSSRTPWCAGPIDGGEYQPLSEYLTGPSALTFVQGDVSAVAKALKDFARANPLLVIKGGLADGSLLSSSDLAALADLPPRDVLLARIAGALAAPMQQMAGLLQALPRGSRLRTLGPDRAEGGRRGDAAGRSGGRGPGSRGPGSRGTRGRRGRGPGDRGTRCGGRSAADRGPGRGRPRHPMSRPRPPRAAEAADVAAEAPEAAAEAARSTEAQPSSPHATFDHRQARRHDTDKTEGKKGRPSRWQGP